MARGRVSREWAHLFDIAIWVGAGAFFTVFGLAWVRLLRKFWLGEMNRHKGEEE